MMIDLPRSITTNGMAFHRSGAGAPVLLIHGVGLRAECWRAQIDDLQKDHEIFAIDLPGHGASERLNCPSPDLNDFTQTVVTFIETKIGKPVVVFGHSMGAMIALDLAARYRDLCAGVGALNAIYRRDRAARQAVRKRAASLLAGCAELNGDRDIATAPVTRWFGSAPVGSDAAAAALCYCWLMQTDHNGYGAAYSVFAHEDGPRDMELANLAVPALFLTGEADLNSTPAMSSIMAENTAQALTIHLAGAGHMALMTHSDEVNMALRRLLNRIPQQGGTWANPSQAGIT